MSTLEYTIHGLRRGWNVTRTFVFCGAFAAAIVSGVFSDFGAHPTRRIAALVLFGLWAALFGVLARERFFKEQPRTGPATARADLELGMLLVVAAHAGIQLAGGLGSSLYPIVFVMVAFLVVYTRRWVGFTLVAITIGLEMSLVLASPGRADMVSSAVHAVFIVLFSLINLVFTRSELVKMRRRTAEQIERTRLALEDDARDFRLTVATSAPADHASTRTERDRLSHCTVNEVRRSMYHHVDLLKRTMGLHTCLLLWIEGRGTTLRLLECVSDAPNITTRKIERGEGVVGAVLQSRAPVTLKGLRPGYLGIPYYDGPAPVTDFLGVPVVESGALRGVLCADRADGRPMEDLEKQSLNAAVESILQIVSNERIFAQLQRAKSEQGKLLSASEALAKALSEDDVVCAALEAAAQIAPFEIAAVALAEGGGRQVVRRAAGEGAEALTGLSFAGNGLAASVLKTRHYLPYRGLFDPKQQTVFDKKTQKVFERMRSALVLPLVAGEEVLGTLTMATSAAAAYGDDVRTTLQVMINQVGTSVKNAMMVRRLEELATTDGLTGLPNHRVFQEELSRQLAQSTRFSTETSMILCDVDKFKNVNDTYGHPVGDMVLRALGETMRRNVVRDTDLPARYGGEEFAIVCAGTDTKGAVKLAEKIRKDLEGQVFATDKGELRCTISMGVATFPHHARSKEDLVERADTALYAAKEGGRNQVRVWEKGSSGK